MNVRTQTHVYVYKHVHRSVGWSGSVLLISYSGAHILVNNCDMIYDAHIFVAFLFFLLVEWLLVFVCSWFVSFFLNIYTSCVVVKSNMCHITCKSNKKKYCNCWHNFTVDSVEKLRKFRFWNDYKNWLKHRLNEIQDFSFVRFVQIFLLFFFSFMMTKYSLSVDSTTLLNRKCFYFFVVILDCYNCS